MIEWAIEGKRILDEDANKDLSQRMDSNQRAAMSAMVRGVQLSGLAFENAQTSPTPEREPETVRKLFASLYPSLEYKGFSHDSQLTLALDAPEAARSLDHNYIGTEHLLMGLISKGSNAEPILRSLGVTGEKVKKEVEFIVGRGDRKVEGDINLTPRAKKTIELAIDYARGKKHRSVTGEDLLIGILQEGEGIGAAILEAKGITFDRVRELISFAQRE